jgi:hypothetical protein
MDASAASHVSDASIICSRSALRARKIADSTARIESSSACAISAYERPSKA